MISVGIPPSLRPECASGFYVWFRAYHPTNGLFDGSWMLDDVEKIK